jgi:hypothetical protein
MSARSLLCPAALFWSLIAPAIAGAVAETTRATAAVQADGGVTAIRVNGQLDDAVWRTATPVTVFVQREPREGAPATFGTEARVAFDVSGIYIAVRAFDPEPDKIVAFLTRRDVRSSSDWIRVLIDSYHDRRTAYEFAVNAAGVKQDAYWFNDSNSDDSWDAVWDVVVSRDAQGWRAEFHIPFSQLRFSRHDDDRVGFAVVREVARLNETSTWPLLAKSASGYVSSFGELTGLAGARSLKRLELMPYTVAQVATVPPEAGNLLQNTVDPGASLGLDLKYAITPALTFTATVNPDFGQVEADPAVVNLSAFETFFSERRPFFVEGSGTYRFDITCFDAPSCTGLFYSRRIGRQPRGEPDLPDDGFSVQPLQSTILGAGKLTGRIGAFSVGALTAVTQEERARIAIGSTRRAQVVEPRTFYSVARARREFADQSSLGLMLTSTNRDLVPDVSFLPASAVTGGVDYDWRVGRRWSLTGHWAGSTVRGSAEAMTDLQENSVHLFQRPDAEHVELDPLATVLNGHAGLLSFSKIAGEHVRLFTQVAYKSPGFEINDLGYLRRADQRTQTNWIQWRSDRPGRYVRSFSVNFNEGSGYNFAGERQFLWGNVNAHWTFQNFWSTGTGFNMNWRGLDDRATRGGPGAYDNGQVGQWMYFNTDTRRPASFHWNSFWSNDSLGTRFVELWSGVQLRPTSSLSADFNVRWASNKNDSQWIEQVERLDRTHYVFGRLNQTTVSMTTRLNYTITPNLSVQLYGEPFASAGRYAGYKELVNGRAKAYADRYAPFAYADNADFNYLSFRTTNVLRWEFKPGSTLFVVWQQGRERDGERGNFRFGRDFREVFSIPSSNTILVKLAYWFNM